MEICYTSDHGEIVFEGRACEACGMIENLREQIKERDGQINDLESEIEEMQRNG